MSSHHTAQECDLQDTRCSPGEEVELEHDMSEGSNDGVERTGGTVNDNLEIRTGLESAEQPEDDDHSSFEEASVESNVDTSATHEFEENERRLDSESDDAAATANEIPAEKVAANESEDKERCTEESIQASHEVSLI